jgi:hypothetical protein
MNNLGKVGVRRRVSAHATKLWGSAARMWLALLARCEGAAAPR